MYKYADLYNIMKGLQVQVSIVLDIECLEMSCLAHKSSYNIIKQWMKRIEMLYIILLYQKKLGFQFITLWKHSKIDYNDLCIWILEWKYSRTLILYRKEIGNYPDDIKIVLYTTGAVVIVTIILMLFFVSKRTRKYL